MSFSFTTDTASIPKPGMRENQDAYRVLTGAFRAPGVLPRLAQLFKERDDFHILALADGFGPQGHVASRFGTERAAEYSLQFLADLTAPSEEDIVSAVHRGFTKAANRLSSHLSERDWSETGSTLDLGVFTRDGRYALAHAGDSRVYAGSPDGVWQLTEDHVAYRSAPPDDSYEARLAYAPLAFPLRAINLQRAPEPQIVSGSLEGLLGMAFVTDGVHRAVHEEEFAEALREGSGAAQRIVERAWDPRRAVDAVMPYAGSSTREKVYERMRGRDDSTALTIRFEEER